MPPGMKHADLGASGAHRWRVCAGSIQLSEGMPDTTSEAAAEGTAAHNFAEDWLRGGGDMPHYTTIVTDDGEFDVTPEMVEHVQVYVDYVLKQAKGKELFIEEHLDLSLLNPPGPMFGTGDALIWDKENLHLEVIDLKYGKGVVVEVEENPQFFQYALGGVLKVAHGATEIKTTVVQPRIEHEDGPIRSWSFDRDYLKAEKKVMFADAAATLEENAPLVAGSHCRFCKAKAICPAQQEQVTDLAQDAFAVEPTFPDRETMSLADIAEVMLKGPAVQDWIKSVGEYALNMAENGEEIPGFKLVEKRTNRRWVDSEATEVYLKGRRLKKEERYKMTLVSPAQAEKVLKTKSGPTLPERLYEKPEGGAALAPLSDKRPEKVCGVQEAFGVLADTSNREEE